MVQKYMAEVCKILDLEFGEKFKLKDCGDYLYELRETGLYIMCDGRKDDKLLGHLLTGELEVVKLEK